MRARAIADDFTREQLTRLHRSLMEDGFCGVDISPIAAHLTASGLSNVVPGAEYAETNIGVVPVCGPDGLTGSVEFLRDAEQPDLLDARYSAAAHQGSAVTSSGKRHKLRVPYEGFDIVVMNPPYQRARGGQRQFDVAGATDADRKKAVRNANKIIKGTSASMQAGLASVFCELARRTAKPGGRIGMVLPMTAAAAPTWAATRDMLERNLDDLVLVWFAAGSAGGAQSMSADTHMGEMLLVGAKRRAARPEKAAHDITCVIIDGAFAGLADAAETGRAVTEMLSSRHRASPDGARQGRLRLGRAERARWAVVPAAHGDPWSLVGASDTDVIALAERLARRGEIVPPDGSHVVCGVPMTAIGELFAVGPTHHLIGHLAGRSDIGAFEFHPIADDLIRKDTALWSANSKRQTAVKVKATHFGLATSSDPLLVSEMRGKASRLFYQRNMRWTSQKLLAAVTDRPVLGGRAWTALISEDPVIRCGFAVWANSTLGMAVHWSRGQRQQMGRSLTQIKAVKAMPCPDFSDPRLRAAAEILMPLADDLFEAELLPANQADRDPARQAIDDAAAAMLGIPADDEGRCGLLRDLAVNWCAEPSVRGR